MVQSADTAAPETAAALLSEFRHMLAVWQHHEFEKRLARMLDLQPTPAERLEIEMFALLVRATGRPEDAQQLLHEATALIARAQTVPELAPHALVEATGWRVLQRVQTLLHLHHAALHSAGMAAAIYVRAGETELAQLAEVLRNDVYYQAEMYAELRESCQALLARGGAIPPMLRIRAHSGAASAAFALAIECDEADQATALWRLAIADHAAGLALAESADLPFLRAVCHLNLAICHATLGDLADSERHLRAIDAVDVPLERQPGWRAWSRHCEALIACHRDPADAGWRQLLAVERELADVALNSQIAFEATLHAIVRIGGRHGHVDDALRASQTLLALQRRHKRNLARSLEQSLGAVIERQQLLDRNAALAEQGGELERSLAVRNAELSQALARLQAEASIRHAAESALQRAHDDLEEQVRLRSAELDRATRTLMQQEKQLALSRMVAGMAHEMNTPIDNARMGASAIDERSAMLRLALNSGALRRQQLDELLAAIGDGSALIDRALNRVALLVQRFKSLAARDDREPRSRFDLVDLIRLAVADWQARLTRADVAVRLDLPEHLVVHGFPEAVRQVLQQLCENSLAHGFAGRPGGRLRVLARREATDSGDGAVELLWQDDGRGIPAEHLPHVFEPFYTTQLGRSGAGLGLASVHSLVVELMGGHVAIDSPAGRGTSVRITMPIGEAVTAPTTTRDALG